MTAYLITTTETYRVNSERAAVELIESAKKDTIYELSKYTSQKKEIKSKGEVIDEYYKVTLTKKFSDEKDPGEQITVDYNIVSDYEEEENE